MTEYGAPLLAESVELREPGPDEFLVKMAFGGVNPVDRYGATGHAAKDGPVPRTLGTEGSGTVDGKPVLVHGIGVGTKRDGLWASAAIVPKRSVTKSSERARIGISVVLVQIWV